MKLFCIGRNYAAHAAEMKSDVPKTPMIFIKPSTSLLLGNKDFYYPSFTNNIHYEVELLIKMKKAGKHVQAKFAHKYYEEIGLGIDFTARDIQAEAKKKGHPWEKAKAFDHSAVVSDFIPLSDFEDVQNIDFYLTLNNEIVQKSNTSDMIFGVNRLIAEITQYFTLQLGDIIMTGTPEGVGPIKIGDKLEGFIADRKMFSFEIK